MQHVRPVSQLAVCPLEMDISSVTKGENREKGQKQKAETTKRAYRTQQSVKGLVLLLGEPSDSGVSALLDSTLALADNFDVASVKLAGCTNCLTVNSVLAHHFSFSNVHISYGQIFSRYAGFQCGHAQCSC